MSRKTRVRRTIRHLKDIKTWQLVILFVLACFVAATFLRLNNIGMVQRREALLTADQTGDSTQIMNRLLDLQHYVTTHMNTDLGTGVTLVGSLERATEKAKQAALSDGNPNGNIYKLADDFCAPQFSSYSNAYLQCFLGQLDKYPAADNLKTDFQGPSTSIYTHNFISPVWSPDFAGFAVLLAGAIGLLVVIRIVSMVILRLLLRWHYKRI